MNANSLSLSNASKNTAEGHIKSRWHKTFFQILFAAALAAPLLNNHYAGLSRAGWVVLVILYTLSDKYQIKSVYFFSAFFSGWNFPGTFFHFKTLSYRFGTHPFSSAPDKQTFKIGCACGQTLPKAVAYRIAACDLFIFFSPDRV